jgi:hypothetical protein
MTYSSLFPSRSDLACIYLLYVTCDIQTNKYLYASIFHFPNNYPEIHELAFRLKKASLRLFSGSGCFAA